MTSYAIYALAGWPVFLVLFVHLTRKFEDVTIAALLAMMVVALVPIAREAVLVWLLLEIRNKVLFKKYND